MNTTSLKNSILITAFAVGFIWCFKAFELNFNVDLSWLGVYPLALHGLIGVITAPLIHGSLEHIFNNTLPMLVLGSFLIYGYPKTRWRVLTTVWLLSGIGVCFFGRESYHIGASGLTHGVFFYLFVVSIFRRDKRSVVLMMVAFFMYGGMTMSIFPRQEEISFEYHLFGALAGVLCACLWHSFDPKPTVKAYSWEVEPKSEDPVIGDQWRLDGQAEENEGRRHTVPNEKDKHE